MDLLSDLVRLAWALLALAREVWGTFGPRGREAGGAHFHVPEHLERSRGKSRSGRR